jgi:hypothetical protein
MLYDMMAADRIAEFRREAARERLASELPAGRRRTHRLHLHLPSVHRHPARPSSRAV